MPIIKQKKTAIAAITILTIAGGCYIAGAHMMANNAERSYQTVVDSINAIDGITVIDSTADFGFLKAKGEMSIAQDMNAFKKNDATPQIISSIQWNGYPSIKGFIIDGSVNHALAPSPKVNPYLLSKLEQSLNIKNWDNLKIRVVASDGVEISLTNPTGKPFYIPPLLMGDVYAVASGQTEVSVRQNNQSMNIKAQSSDGSIFVIQAKHLLSEMFNFDRKNLFPHIQMDHYNGELDLLKGRLKRISLQSQNAAYAFAGQTVNAQAINVYFNENTQESTINYDLDISTNNIESKGISLGKAAIKANLNNLNKEAFYYTAEKLPMIVSKTEDGRKYDRGGENHRQMLGHMQALLEGGPRIDIEEFSASINLNGSMAIDLDATGHLAFDPEGLPSGLMTRSDQRLRSYNYRKHFDVVLDVNLPEPILKSLGIPANEIQSGRQEFKVKDDNIYFNGRKLLNFF